MFQPREEYPEVTLLRLALDKANEVMTTRFSWSADDLVCIMKENDIPVNASTLDTLFSSETSLVKINALADRITTEICEGLLDIIEGEI